MARITVVMLALGMLTVGTQVDAQGRQDRRSRQEIARAQGVPPGQLPPSGLCRVWYDNRSPGRQPAATTCREAERMAVRDRNARVIYGENVYNQYGQYGQNSDRAVSRPGRNRDPQISRDRNDTYRDPNDPYYDRNGRYDRNARYTTPAFQSGYRDGLSKGREDADDNDRYDPNRHSWYRSATRGYEDEYGTKPDYQARYREGFDAGYAEGYRALTRR